MICLLININQCNSKMAITYCSFHILRYTCRNSHELLEPFDKLSSLQHNPQKFRFAHSAGRKRMKNEQANVGKDYCKRTLFI